MKIRRRRILRKGGISRGVYILPNLCTTGSLFCGFFAVIQILKGDFVTASWVILLAGIFDLFDGQLARLTSGASQFGIEYDSLVDLASFGFAPAILIYRFSLEEFNRVGWIVSFLFFACGALRLARYNVQAEGEERRHFQGLPVPMAAYTLATTVIFYDVLFESVAGKNVWILCLTLALGLLMVSTIRYRNAKELHFSRRISFFVLVAVAAAISFVAWRPAIMMWIVSIGYVLSGPMEELIYWVMNGKRLENLPVEKKEKLEAADNHSPVRLLQK
ncbi:MAG: CDP-diacylglycerol--serine O-phosphatidyltransferase [Deltaproteobacteria bacterium]|nr:CDP-diacylglycerol--serine O-phosphatidyltransferase [Deltaproteobacteria bacterium]